MKVPSAVQNPHAGKQEMQKRRTRQMKEITILNDVNLLFSQAMSTRIRTILKPHVFIWIRVNKALNRLWRAVSNQCGFRDRIHWFREDGRPIRIKKYAASKLFGSMWTLPQCVPC